ncbi:MAG: glycosyltransferase family 4 protein [Bacteroidetes bacterium]|nr:glycosyltransferase family 4 protein [Bacteroidota bacterium]
MKKIYFIVPYPHGEAPSQRFRFEQYYTALAAHGFDFHISAFLDHDTWHILYKPGHTIAKVQGILRGFWRRCMDLLHIVSYDFVFMHREAAPIGPPVFEWIITKILGKKIIYDFDDAIWLSNTSAHNKIAARLKWHSKVSAICKWAWKVSCGNDYLAHYARSYNTQVVVNPTTIDTEHLHNRVKDQHTDRIVIGWTGTHSTAQYLDHIIPILARLEQQYDFTFMVISNRKLKADLRSLQYQHWHKESEIADLLQFNIGLMPLTDDPWARGKCGFKALQYMSLGIPALVSPVGVNTRIVDDHVNGMICSTDADWERAITTYLSDADQRIRAGAAARRKIEAEYSVASNTPNFIRLFS